MITTLIGKRDEEGVKRNIVWRGKNIEVLRHTSKEHGTEYGYRIIKDGQRITVIHCGSSLRLACNMATW
jgi:hypothetical protein